MSDLHCHRCRAQATVSCLCTKPPTLLCSAHRTAHLSTAPPQDCYFHLVTSVNAVFLSDDRLGDIRPRLSGQTTNYENLKKTLVGNYQRDVQLLKSRYTESQGKLRASAEKELQQLKSCYKRGDRYVEAAAESVRMHCFEAYEPENPFESFIINPAQVTETLLDVRIGSLDLALGVCVRTDHVALGRELERCGIEKEPVEPANLRLWVDKVRLLERRLDSEKRRMTNLEQSLKEVEAQKSAAEAKIQRLEQVNHSLEVNISRYENRPNPPLPQADDAIRPLSGASLVSVNTTQEYQQFAGASNISRSSETAIFSERMQPPRSNQCAYCSCNVSSDEFQCRECRMKNSCLPQQDRRLGRERGWCCKFCGTINIHVWTCSYCRKFNP